MRYYATADWVFPITSAPLAQGVLVYNQAGEILEVLPLEALPQGVVLQSYAGALVPGFINTHCHLELSHLKGRIAQHTGLVGFVQEIIKQRQAGDAAITAAMLQADKEMYNNGIVAVADISNLPISAEVKRQSSIFYHTFIEVLGFNPAAAVNIVERAKALQNAFGGLCSSIVPHAPYTVSDALFKALGQLEQELLSIHNQETEAEEAFFQNKTGDFLKLYEFLNLSLAHYVAPQKSSLQHYLPMLAAAKILLVHNTFTSDADRDFALAQHQDLYWCACPQANLYIEGQLPQLEAWQKKGLKITLGTDSLASNKQLNILSEMQCLQQAQGINFEQLLYAATLEGAHFLGQQDLLGSFDRGKRPGINLIQIDENFNILSDQVKRITA